MDKNIKIDISKINCSDVKEIERGRTGFSGGLSVLAVFSLLALLLLIIRLVCFISISQTGFTTAQIIKMA